MKGQIAHLELKKLEKRKEIEFFEERRDMDYVPLVVWGLLTLSQVILLGLDLFFGWWNARFNWAIIMASMTPFVLLFCGFFFIKTTDTTAASAWITARHYSSRAKHHYSQ